MTSILDRVMTATEAARVFDLDDSTVKKACEQGRIQARKSAGTWLVIADECDHKWGARRSHTDYDAEIELQKGWRARAVKRLEAWSAWTDEEINELGRDYYFRQLKMLRNAVRENDAEIRRLQRKLRKKELT